MPLTEFQAWLARLLATNRTPDSYLAGGAAIHIEPNTTRYSNDLDYFHDSVERVASAFAEDRALLEANGCNVQVDLSQPGYVRTRVEKESEATKIEWAHDSAWRFLPTIASELCGYQLHPIDLATNKVLTLAGRDEPRDYLDTLHVHRETLPLGALCWAAVGKDPGFSPLSLLELLRRRGKYRPEDFSRLRLVAPTTIDLAALKTEWLTALESADRFVRSRPAEEAGCLYYAATLGRFVEPGNADGTDGETVQPHFGRPGGVLPTITDG